MHEILNSAACVWIEQCVESLHRLPCCEVLRPGDQIAHLWWRLEHGQMPATRMPKVAVVLIGTNDLFAEADCIADNETALETSVNGIFKRWPFPLTDKHTPKEGSSGKLLLLRCILQEQQCTGACLSALHDCMVAPCAVSA